MRPGQHKNRSRGRGRRPGNPTNRVFESNGPDVKVRGNAQHVAEKYLQLARDAQSSGDSVMAENYYQHAEHYLRILAATQPVNAQGQPGARRPFGADELDDEDGLDADDEDAFVAGQGPQPDMPAGEAREPPAPRPDYPPREHRDQREHRNDRPPREGGEGRDWRGDDHRREQRGDSRPAREGYRPRDHREGRDWRSRDDQRPPRDDQRPPRDDQRPPRPEPRHEPRHESRPDTRPAPASEGGPIDSGDDTNGWAAPDFLRRSPAGGGPGRPRREPRAPRPERRPTAEGAGDAPAPVETAPDETAG